MIHRYSISLEQQQAFHQDQDQYGIRISIENFSMIDESMLFKQINDELNQPLVVQEHS